MSASRRRKSPRSFEATSAAELGDNGHALAGTFVRAHAVGYDLGLFFFAVNCALMGVVVRRASFGPRWLGAALGLAGAVYAVGSALRVLSPTTADAFAPAYLLPFVAELAFALTLIRHRGHRERMTAVPEAGRTGLQPRLA
jgi:hypothetical protein